MSAESLAPIHSQIVPGLVSGPAIPNGWQSIRDLPLLVFVGVTGVGKSTTLESMMKKVASSLLPDRRVLTDDLIIAEMQRLDGAPVAPVKDRKLRFEYTRRYRDLHPGGMAAALAHLVVEPATLPGLLIFDGLRGDNEVKAAAQALPHAFFIMLDAPDIVRLQRLLGRGDSFDQISVRAINADPALVSFESIGVPDAADLFSLTEEQILLQLVRSGAANLDDLRAKLAIVIEERRNYDPTATRMALIVHAEKRALVLDTTKHGSKKVAQMVIDKIKEWGLVT